MNMGGIIKAVYLLCFFFGAHVAAMLDSHGASTTSGGSHSLRNLNSRIIGGSTANTQRYPYFTLLNIFHTYYGSHRSCGGTLIASDVVLTAAHCISKEDDEDKITVDVWVNSTSREYSEYEYYRTTTQLVLHPDYAILQSGVLTNDIGLIFLEEPVLGVPMPQMNTNSSIPSNTAIMPLTIIGLGASNATKNNYSDDWFENAFYDYTYPEHLMEASIQTTPMNKCIKSYGSVNVKNSIICHSDTGLKGVCYGDSGGPVLIPAAGASSNQDVQVGISSWLPVGGSGSCTQAGKAQGATRVSHYAAWINDQICKYSNNKPITCPPTTKPTQKPTKSPTTKPTKKPTKKPTRKPNIESN